MKPYFRKNDDGDSVGIRGIAEAGADYLQNKHWGPIERQATQFNENKNQTTINWERTGTMGEHNTTPIVQGEN